MTKVTLVGPGNIIASTLFTISLLYAAPVDTVYPTGNVGYVC